MSDEMREALLPCPFCEGRHEIEYTMYDTDVEYTSPLYFISDCVKASHKREEVVAAWNRRASKPIAGGYAVTCPEKGTVFCIGQDSALQVQALLKSTSKWPEQVLIKDVEIFNQDGRWCSNLLDKKKPQVTEGEIAEWSYTKGMDIVLGYTDAISSKRAGEIADAITRALLQQFEIRRK